MKNYHSNEIAYCVNFRGQKVKPYKCTPPPKKLSKLKRIINFLFK